MPAGNPCSRHGPKLLYPKAPGVYGHNISCLWLLSVFRFIWFTVRNTGHKIEASVLQRYIDGSVQDWSNSSALAMELLQSCTEPSTWYTNMRETILTWAPATWRLKSQEAQLFVQQFVQVQLRQISKLRIICPFWAGHRWILFTKGHWCGQRFLVMIYFNHDRGITWFTYMIM